jgi:hypothetical protein
MNLKLKSILKIQDKRPSSPLERSLRRSAYIPKSKSPAEIESILKRYLKLDLSPCPLKECESFRYGAIRDSSYNEKCKEIKKIKSLTLSKKTKTTSKSLFFKARRSHIRNSEGQNNTSLIVKKWPLCKSISIKNKKQRGSHRFKHSNYTSYSDIYNVLVEKIPLNSKFNLQ